MGSLAESCLESVVFQESVFMHEVGVGDLVGFIDVLGNGWVYQLVSDADIVVDSDLRCHWAVCVAGSGELELEVGDVVRVRAGSMHRVWRVMMDRLPDLDLRRNEDVALAALKDLVDV